jgi:hypothetical protein
VFFPLDGSRSAIELLGSIEELLDDRDDDVDVEHIGEADRGEKGGRQSG